eukprot:SRR837773.16840.p3 GENE.SRR837773.16840~~SRR837773.16840.p3  ORF type:complete len:207 (+),score=91.91 SRR837773.16840:96-623(+)
MGVGTNYFPMDKSKIPKLQSMLTAEEMKHVEAFPSVLRLLLSWRLLEELTPKVGSLSKLKSIKFHRVIDNMDLEMNMEDFWVQLNYQMIHFLDFAPTADWEHGVSQTVFQGCLRLYDFLNKAGQLRAKVIINPVSISGVMPTLKKVVGARVLAGYSAKIGHSLDYELCWEAGSKL